MKRFLILALLFLINCGDGSNSSLFTQPLLTFVDSANNYLFVIEKDKQFFVFDATSIEAIGESPFVDDENATDIFDILPRIPTHAFAININGTSRIFIAGAVVTETGTTAFNQILVLDFDGTNLTQASFSPIELDDSNPATDEADNVIGGLVYDSANNRIYATDLTDSMLYGFNAQTGAQDIAPISIAGKPNNMSLEDGHLYVANSSSTEAQQVITVVNTTTLATTVIDLDMPTDDIAVKLNSNGTVLLAKHAISQLVKVHTVDTTTFANSTPILAGDDSVNDGQIDSGEGISSAVGGLLLTTDSTGTIFGYVGLSDGLITRLDFTTDLSSFTATTLETVTSVLTGLSVRTSGGHGATVFMVASASGDLVYTSVGSAEVEARF